MRSREGASLTRAGPRGAAPRSAERCSRNATLWGRTRAARHKNTHSRENPMYSRYLLRKTRRNTPITIRCRTATADFYGWSNHFEKYISDAWTDPNTGTQYLASPQLGTPSRQAGYSLCIARTADRQSNKATYCNYFRISSDATIADIAQVAKFTDVDWNWLETPSGERRSREKWIAIHEAWTQGREGGVVSL